MSASSKDPRQHTEAEIIAMARRGKTDPQSLTASEIRAIALYVVQARNPK